jgi:branched-chain amino acid transport system substrate-binding protein
MTTRFKKTSWLLATAAMMSAFGALQAPAALAQTVLGVSAPMTGPRALLGKYTKQGVDMAVEEVNAAGGVLGKPISVVFEDDQGDNPNAAINSVSRLMNVHNVPVIIGPHFSVAQLATQKAYCDGAHISITGASGVPVTENGCNFVIRVRGNDNLQGKALVAYALEHLKAKKIGVLSINDDFGKGGAGRVLAALKESGVTPVAVESHNPQDTDFSAQLARLRDAGAELVILWTHDNESALIVRQARQYGLPMKFAGSTSLSQPSFIKLSGSTGEGVISASDFIVANPDERVQAFVKKFRERYKADPELYAATYYDAVKLAAQTINAVGSTDAKKVREEFSKLNTPGVLATYKCEANGDCNHQTNIVEIKKGEPVLLTVVKF